MGKRKKPDDEDRVEELEQQIRELKSINRHLMKRLKKLDRGFKYDEIYDEDDVSNKNMCPDCSRGELIEIFIINRKLTRCEICGYRRTEKLS